MRSPCSCLTKAPPLSEEEERNEETGTGGGGIIERGASRLFLVVPCRVVFCRAVVCVCAGVNVSICAFMYQSLCVCDHVTAMHVQSWSTIC